MADTRTQLLDVAQRLVQRRGYNAFSFKDLAKAVEIKTASVHYHFPSKADLGQALIERYTHDLGTRLEAIDDSVGPARERIDAFVDIYERTLQQDAICLCGSLAADRPTLPEPVARGVRGYLGQSERWLRETLVAGVSSGELPEHLEPGPLATMILASLQGGLVVARARDGAEASAVLQSVRRSIHALLA